MGIANGKIKRLIATDSAAKVDRKPQQFQITEALRLRQEMLEHNQPISESEDQIKAMNLEGIRQFCQRCRTILHRLEHKKNG